MYSKARTASKTSAGLEKSWLAVRQALAVIGICMDR